MHVCYSLTSRQQQVEPDAGWSSLAARRAHNPKVTGSNPVPATNKFQVLDAEDLAV
jgi:hypothetical protein